MIAIPVRVAGMVVRVQDAHFRRARGMAEPRVTATNIIQRIRSRHFRVGKLLPALRDAHDKKRVEPTRKKGRAGARLPLLAALVAYEDVRPITERHGGGRCDGGLVRAPPTMAAAS